jgi:SAM-dependent methyltransferase
MAFNLVFARHLMLLGKEKSFHGHLVCLSRYTLSFSYPMIRELAAEIGVDLKYQPQAGEVVDDAQIRMPGAVFFKMLGFSRITEIELFETGPGLFRFDLNQSQSPAQLVDTADAVFDLGTSEHVFHTPNVLCHIGRLLKVGGLVLHHTPCNNHFNHGFYQFSPTLYFDYYRANGYEPEGAFINIFEDWNSPEQIINPFSADEGWREFMKTDPNEPSMFIFLARKQQHSTVGVWPQQRYYLETVYKAKAKS